MNATDLELVPLRTKSMQQFPPISSSHFMFLLYCDPHLRTFLKEQILLTLKIKWVYLCIHAFFNIQSFESNEQSCLS